MKKGKIIFFIFLVLTIIWFVIMTVLSHQVGEETKTTSRSLAEQLKFINGNTKALNYHLRHAAHVIVFFIFMVLWGITIWISGKTRWLLSIPFIWAVVDEATKPFITGRHFAWIDVGRNEAGALAGFLVVCLISQLSRKRR